MPRTVSIGAQDFAKLKSRDRFLVDKTSFIKEWWDNGDDVTLITRPRRFGKTLNLSMVERFFSNQYDDQEELFGDMAVWQDEEMQTLAGQFPVLSLSFAKIKNDNFSATKKRLAKIVSDAFATHRELLTSEILLPFERDACLEHCKGIDPDDTADTLSDLCRYLSIHNHGKKVILLLDEYDTPMQEAYVHGFWTELVEFTRNIFNAAFKTNPYLERALMTGITRVSRESLFSDLNNLDVATITSEKYETSFGFTEEEVFASMEEFGLSNKEDVRFWYDGFVFGRVQDIYNPWSITQFLDKKGKLNAYWINTSSNSLAGKLIREGSADLKKDFEVLLSGGTVTARIKEEVVFSELNSSKDAVFSLLMATGYLKPIHVENRQYTLALTNHEVTEMFEDMVRMWFQDAESEYNDFIRALLLGDLKWMNSFMNDIALQTFSSFDTGNKPSKTEPERFYHGFVLGLMVELKDRYHIRSNRESGFGRYDVVMEPRDRAADFAYILEFKTHDAEDETDLQATVRAALQQIEDKQYAADLIALGISPDRIRKYGFAFQGKTVLIGESE